MGTTRLGSRSSPPTGPVLHPLAQPLFRPAAALHPAATLPRMSDAPEPQLADAGEFFAVDMRVGRIVAAEEFPEARVPAWKLRVDFGPEVGEKRSSAQITHYEREELEGRQVIGVVNLPPRRIGPFRSEVLVLGALDPEKGVVLLRPDEDAQVGARIA